MDLYSSLDCLKNVGVKRLGLYKKLNINTICDLLTYFPKEYIDCSESRIIKYVRFNEKNVVKAKVLSKSSAKWFKNKNVFVCKILAADEDGEMFEIIYFNNVYIYSKLCVGNFYIFYGRFEKKPNGVSLLAPEILQSMGFIPKYSLTKGLTTNILQSNLKQALSYVKDCCYILPKDLVLKYNFPDLKTALLAIHFPKTKHQYEKAREMFIFKELLCWQVGLLKLKSGVSLRNKSKIEDIDVNEFLDALPFKITNAQRKVIYECIADCSKDILMNRLIQGDVGSGKTVVAAALVFIFVRSGMQVALMAPTDILARQHYNTFCNFFKIFNFNICVLVGSLKAKEKNKLIEGIKSGEYSVVIGTHAIFQDSVLFKNLGLIITDEQHRFGVKQREKLIAKGESVNILVMSATPIPRTLALIVYGDMNVSTIDELPPGRVAVSTYWVSSKLRKRVFNFLEKEIKNKHQVYIVCPAIEDSKKNVQNVCCYANMLKENGFSKYNVGVMHGQLDSATKNSVMQDFVSGNIDVLVTTTVIEVGVDVLNASVIVIENAEMFGLAQLHQLRGRVGRGNLKSYCILISDLKSADNKKRMDVLCKTNSGFEIAKKDLALRGPGDFFGIKQHGDIEFKIANLKRDFNIACICKKEAEHILELDRDLAKIENATIKGAVNKLFSSDYVVI